MRINLRSIVDEAAVIAKAALKEAMYTHALTPEFRDPQDALLEAHLTWDKQQIIQKGRRA